MPSSFVLKLDTHAPVVTWGAPSNVNAGEELSIPYALNEPSITAAQLVLSDGRTLNMATFGGVLTVTLPDDAPDGEAQVRAYVVDDVGNAATRTLAVMLNGGEGPPPPPPAAVGPGWGGRRPEPKPVLVTGRSSAVCSSRSRVHVGTSTTTRGRARSRYVAPSQRVVRRTSRATAASSARLAVASAVSPAVLVGSSRAKLWKRPEGPGTEDELMVLLGLL